VEGRSGIAAIESFDASNLRSRIAGEVSDFKPEDHLDRTTIKRTARFTQLALVAAREAVAQAGLDGSVDKEQVAVVVGSGIGGMEVLEHEHTRFLERGPGRFHPLTVPLVIPNMAAAAVSVDSGFLGPNVCLTTACATGAHSIGTALDMIRAGRAVAAVAGSTESTMAPHSVDGYCQLRALSTRNDTPTTASRPFSVDRDGFVIAEGAGMLLLEDLEHAINRGADILAELAGYGTTSDGHHITAPHPKGQGAVRAMTNALADAGMTREDIEVVNAHGTSTPLNDVIETAAIRTVFGAHADSLAVHSTKSMTGHALGAAASLEAVVAVLTIRHGVIHPTINLHEADPACDLDYVPNQARRQEVSSVLSNSFAFGGHNGVLIFRAYRP